MRTSTLLAVAASIAASSAGSLQGFNYGSTKSDGSFQQQSDFEALFSTAKKVSNGFSSARLYTMIQGGSSTNEPISAIPAAIAQDTTLLLGIWASAGDGQVQAELTALQTAITKWGSKFTDLVVGISVGSEDLYRVSPTGIESKAGTGANPDDIVSYIKQVRQALASTALSKVPIGHVDTWTAWANSSNSAVADAVDWAGMDAYPYFQNTMSNSVDAGAGLFNDALQQVQSAVGSKEVWVTETGWPVSGKTENLAVPSVQNAKAYWDAVGCPNFGKMNMFWFTLQDAAPVTPNPSFGIVGSTLSDTPLFDLSCKDVAVLPTTTAPTASGTGGAGASSTGAGSTPTGSGTTFSATSNPSNDLSSTPVSNSSPTSSLSSPGSASGSSSGSGPGYGTGSGSGFSSGSPSGSPSSPTSSYGSGAASPSGSSSGVPGSPANSSTIGSSSSGSKGGSSGASTGGSAGTGSGSAAAPTTSVGAASGMLTSGAAAGFIAAAAAAVAVL